MTREEKINSLLIKITANAELVNLYTIELSKCMQANQDLVEELAKMYAEATLELQKKINSN